MDWNLVAVMIGIHALMFLTPGPDSIIVVSRATAQGIRHAMAATFGIISGGLILVPGIAFGLDFVNSLSPAIWFAVRAAGAIYLVFIGYRILSAQWSLRKKTGVEEDTNTAHNDTVVAAYLQGFLTNLGNPKMIVLLTSFLPQFVSVELGNISFQILMLGLIMYLNGLACFTLIAFVAITLKKYITQRFGSRSLSMWGNGLAGGTMLGVGLWMLIAPLRYLVSPQTR